MYNFSKEELQKYINQYYEVEDENPELLYDSCDDMVLVYEYIENILVNYLAKDTSVSRQLRKILADNLQGADENDLSTNFMEAPLYEVLCMLSSYYLAGFIEAKYMQASCEQQKEYLQKQIFVLENFIKNLPPSLQDNVGQIQRLLNGAKGRLKLDFDTRLSIKEIAALSKSNEKSVYNAISTKSLDIDKNKKISNTSAEKWLSNKIKPSLWKNFIGQDIKDEEFFSNILDKMEGKQPLLSTKKVRYFLVPVSKGNDVFNASLFHNGFITVGKKGNEVKYSTFEEALNALIQMDSPYWRRPNEKGNWGIVKGEYWVRKSNVELNLEEK